MICPRMGRARDPQSISEPGSIVDMRPLSCACHELACRTCRKSGEEHGLTSVSGVRIEILSDAVDYEAWAAYASEACPTGSSSLWSSPSQ